MIGNFSSVLILHIPFLLRALFHSSLQMCFNYLHMNVFGIQFPCLYVLLSKDETCEHVLCTIRRKKNITEKLSDTVCLNHFT